MRPSLSLPVFTSLYKLADDFFELQRTQIFRDSSNDLTLRMFSSALSQCLSQLR